LHAEHGCNAPNITPSAARSSSLENNNQTGLFLRRLAVQASNTYKHAGHAAGHALIDAARGWLAVQSKHVTQIDW
jgi:hypothetical protein